MESCFVCGAETTLYFGIHPICVGCADKRSTGMEPKSPAPDKLIEPKKTSAGE